MSTEMEHSQILDTKTDTSQSSSDHEDEPQRGCNTVLTETQWEELSNRGFCEVLEDETVNSQLAIDLINGYVRNNYQEQVMVMAQDIIRVIFDHYVHKVNTASFVQLNSGGESPVNYLTSRVNILLSKELTMSAESKFIVNLNGKVPSETLENVLQYLSHHKGKEPDPLPSPLRSNDMKRICSDPWDAQWIDGFTKKNADDEKKDDEEVDKKAIFELITAANELHIESLTHLGCAKIATLIKQLDQKEISRIIEKEEQYRREQTEKESVELGQQESVSGSTSNDDDKNGDDLNNEDCEQNVQTIINDEKGINQGNNDEKQ